MSKCDCQWLPWIPRCYGHCKPKQVQLLDLSITKDAATITKNVEEASTITKNVEEAAIITKDAKVTSSSSECICFDSESHYLKWLPPCKGLPHCPMAKTSTRAGEDKVISETKVAPAVQPEPIQLLDLSNTKVEENVCNTKSAAQVFMEGKVEQIIAKEKLKTKLVQLEKEVELGRTVLEQTKTLRKSKEALLLRKVRVSYNKCHKFWRGQVISACLMLMSRLMRRREGSG